ncbi:hypothetical protein Tco_0767132 [Tanacetum coccineum]
MMAIPKEHMRRFHGMDDAKEIWEAIRTRFGGNANQRNTEGLFSKQQFLEAFFTIYSFSEGLEKGYDRFQQLLSQLEAHGAEVSTEDANHKFLRSLPPAWSNLAMTMRTKPMLTLYLSDDLYINVRVFEHGNPSRFIKNNDFKDVPHPLSGDYTPKPPEEIDGIFGGSLGTSFDHSVDPDLDFKWTNINSVRPRVNTVNSNVNIVRSRQPVPTRTSNKGTLYKHYITFSCCKGKLGGGVPVFKTSVGSSTEEPDKPNVKGVGYRWMFDIDYLTDSMNYIPVSLENQTNPHAGASEVTNSAGTSQTPSSNASEEKDEDVELIVVPSTVKNTEEKAESRKSSTNSKKRSGGRILTEPQQEKKASSTDTSEDNPKILAFRRELEEIALKHLGKVSENTSTSTPSVNTGSESVNTGSFDPDDSPMPELEIFHKSETGIFVVASLFDEEGVITDFNSLPTEIEVSHTPTLRIHNIHPKSQILGDPKSAEGLKRFLSSTYMKLEFKQCKEELNKRDESGVVGQNKASIGGPKGTPQEEFSLELGYATLSTIPREATDTRGRTISNKTLFIKRDKKDIMLVQVVETAITLMETKVALTKDEEVVDVDVHLYRSMISSLMYLTASRLDIIFAKPDESAGFAEIVDFLRGSNLRYALTTNPTIYDSLVKQFWQTATANTLADGTLELHATIDTIVYTITEASIRNKLQLADASGITMLPNNEIFEGMGNMGYPTDGSFTFWKSFFTPQWRFLVHHIWHCHMALRVVDGFNL